jgi:hypothetical protein
VGTRRGTVQRTSTTPTTADAANTALVSGSPPFHRPGR